MEKNCRIFENFFDDIEDINTMTSEPDAAEKDNSGKTSVYVIFSNSYSIDRKTNTGISGYSFGIEHVFETSKAIVLKFLDTLLFVDEPDVEFYMKSYHPEQCEIVKKIGSCTVHCADKFEAAQEKCTSFGMKIYFNGKAKNIRQCLQFLVIMDRIFETIMTKIAFVKNYFIVPYRKNDDYYEEDESRSIYVDCNLISLYNITPDKFNKLKQDEKTQILFLLRQITDLVDLPSQLYSHFKTDISKEVLRAQNMG